MNKLRAVIINGGEIQDYGYIKALLRDDDTVICADGGYNHAVKMGIVPCAIVGDFDSIDEKAATQLFSTTEIECVIYPEKKNFTDSELAIEYARERGFKDFLLLGATGTRLDHSLANILNLVHFANRGENAVIINENNKIQILSPKKEAAPLFFAAPKARCGGSAAGAERGFAPRSEGDWGRSPHCEEGDILHIHEPASTLVSLVGITNCYGVTTQNLEFPLENATIPMGKGLGVSNVMKENNAAISIKEGQLLVIISKD